MGFISPTIIESVLLSTAYTTLMHQIKQKLETRTGYHVFRKNHRDKDNKFAVVLDM